MINVTVNNTPQVLGKLKSAIRKSLLESGEVVLNTAKEKVPYDTGRLQRSLNAKMNGDDQVQIGSADVEYNIYVECGTSKMKAQPYLLPALKNNESKIKSIFESNLK